jgi:predicted RNase H-like nuclease (RuvC/YqgF family)
MTYDEFISEFRRGEKELRAALNRERYDNQQNQQKVKQLIGMVEECHALIFELSQTIIDQEMEIENLKKALDKK